MLTNPLAITELFRGFVILNIVLSPLTLLVTAFITIMGASNPDKPSVLSTLGIVAGFIYGAPLGALLWLIIVGKLSDALLQLTAITTLSVSWIGIFLAAVLLVVMGNIFIDNLYQWKQGNYRLSILALLITLTFVVVVYAAAYLPIPFISK